MAESSDIKVLVVDDLPEKLLVYRSILELPGLELVTVRSGGEALRLLLKHDFAVILLDVNMPEMDGYETAGIIRTNKRLAHTPIIFITSYADELHALKGYAYGAVDYILAPVVPDVLRTKVKVFVELYRKTVEVQRQADELRELQSREHQRELWETHERLRLALEAGLMGACEWDLQSKLLSLVAHAGDDFRLRAARVRRLRRAIDRKAASGGPRSSAGDHRRRRDQPRRSAAGTSNHPPGRDRLGRTPRESLR